ncbi:MAG: pyridoxamine kinase [Ruminococcaceae bacterium]|nr:pyridoxamine kinase [Oscillospiraceae bacterium]
MAYGKILTIQDISCLGQCSMTVALPILSACGHETCILPSAILSTHTGGFGPVHKKDLTADFQGILNHWQELNVTFDAVYTGYLSSVAQMEYVKNVFSAMVAPAGARIVDPAMADHGKLYSGFDSNYVEGMKELCAAADVILPNVTEACLLTDTPYPQDIGGEFIAELLEKLGQLCPCVVLTGVGYRAGETGVAVWQQGKLWHYTQERIPKSFHGTGDIFAAAFVGAWQQEKTLEEAVKIAADYTALCIRKTCEAPAHWYGVKFETALPELVKRLFLPKCKGFDLRR